MTVVVSVLLALAVLLITLVGTAYAFLNSERFQKRLVTEINRRTQCEVKFSRMRIHLWRSANLYDVQLSSSRIRPCDFLKAGRLHLHFNLIKALFNQRIALEEIKLTAPLLTLDLSRSDVTGALKEIATVSHADGPSVDEGGGENHVETGPPAVDPVKGTASVSTWLRPPPINLERLLTEDGKLILILPDRKRIILHEMQLKASFAADPSPGCMGTILCGKADAPYGLIFTEVRLDFFWRAEGFEIPRFKARCYGGTVEARFKLDATTAEMPFDLSGVANGISTGDLMAGNRAKNRMVEGILQTQLTLQGLLVDPLQASGVGQIRMLEGRLINVPALVYLGGFLNRTDEYSRLPLKKCELDLMLHAGTLQIPRLTLASAAIELSGNGSLRLTDQTQEFQMKLALAKDVAGLLPESTMEGATSRPDGGVEIPFRTWGGINRPKHDLGNRFAPLATKAFTGALFDRLFKEVGGKQAQRKDPHSNR